MKMFHSVNFLFVSLIFCVDVLGWQSHEPRIEKMSIIWQFDTSVLRKEDNLTKTVEILVPVDGKNMIQMDDIVYRVAHELGIRAESVLLFFKSQSGTMTPLCNWLNAKVRYISRCFGRRIPMSKLQAGGTVVARVLEIPRKPLIDVDDVE